MQKTSPAPTWDLSSIFPGGSASAEFGSFCTQVRNELTAAKADLKRLSPVLNDSSRGVWATFILQLQSLAERLLRAAAFAHCLVSQDVADADAQRIEADLYADSAAYENLRTGLEALAARQPDDQWEKLVSSPELSSIRFFLDELRTIAREKLPVEQESLVNDLAVDGYHAWNRLYEKMSGDLRTDFVDEKGQTENLSFGQLATKMSSPDRSIRRQAYEKMNEMWQPVTDLAAMALNSQAGFRLALYKRRGWDSPPKEPLILCRMKKDTLDAMWRTVAKNIGRLKPYIEAKKRRSNIDRFMWYDQIAPVGGSKQSFPFDAAVKFIVDNLRDFSGEMADFSEMAIDKRWVEAENRPGKRAGGYCTGFGDIRENRIFMTYSDNYSGLRVLAHELGHAWHSRALREVDFFATRYPLNLAETASTFNELLVADAAFEQASDDDTRLMLLDQKLLAAFAYMSNIYARYLFDLAFYARRREGVVTKDELGKMMLNAQKEAFGDLLDPEGFHEFFWATKLHFFLTAQPFYNFPYTFGFLFANGVYARAREEGPAFAKSYKGLLQDTGTMQSEDVAEKHLGVDLTKEGFWQSALDRVLADVDKFAALAVRQC